jgi:hypothetical protein
MPTAAIVAAVSLSAALGLLGSVGIALLGAKNAFADRD